MPESLPLQPGDWDALNGYLSAGALSVQQFGAKLDGTTDDSDAVNKAFLSGAGAYTVPAGKTMKLAAPVTMRQDAWLRLMPGATVKVDAALNNSTLFTQPTAAGPNLRCGVVAPYGHGVIDPSACSGVTVFDLHSPQFNRFEGLDILAAADQTGYAFKIACDVTSTGGYGNNRNAVMNYIGKITAGKCGTFLSAAGAQVGSQVVTLNTVEHINALNQGTGFISLGPFADNNYFLGTMRCSLNQNNAVGLNIAADAATYFNCFQSLQIDTFAGKTGRIGIQLGNGSSRTMVYGYFNDPVAEGGSIVDNGSAAHYIIGEWQGVGTTSSGLSIATKGLSPISSIAAVTYSASMTPDHLLVEPNGILTITPTNTTAMTVNNPTNVGRGTFVTYDFLNSSGGTMGAVTFGANYHLAGAFTNPANTKHRTITFYSPDGTILEEVSRATADI